MPLFSESQEKIFGDILTDILNNTNLTRTSPGGKVRSVAEALSKKMGKMWRTFDLNVGQAFIDGAKGQYLDFFGDMMAVARLSETAASISALDRNIKFYVDSGTFGDINLGSSIIITAGSIISTLPDGGGTLYKVTVNTLLSSTSNEAYVGVQSIGSGSTVNLGSKQLIYHDFTNYIDITNDSLKVTNEADIIQAQDIERDANYRFRITNQLLNLETGNDTAIRLSALSVPGVADIVISKFHRGIGTYDILLKSVTPTISTELIEAVQSSIDRSTAEGIFATARGPVEIGVSLVGTLTLRRKISAQEQTDLLQSVTTNITDYINDLDIGEDLITNELIERVMATSDIIKNLGESNKPFDHIYIYTPSKLEDNKIRATLINDYTPNTDERLIVENRYAGTTPILFRIIA